MPQSLCHTEIMRTYMQEVDDYVVESAYCTINEMKMN